MFNKSQTALIQYPGARVGSYIVPNGVTSIGYQAFSSCTSLTGLTLPNGVANIDMSAFAGCSSLTNLTIPSSVTSIGWAAFGGCTSLSAAYFQGDAPTIGASVFFNDYKLTIYYLPGTTGWSATFGERPAILWNPQAQATGAGFGVGTNGFGFNITGTANIPIVVEACANLTSPVWILLQNCTLTNGSLYFGDPQWTNYPSRFYRLRSP